MDDLNASLIGAFLEDLENRRRNGAKSRNLRLTAIRSFFRFASLEAPAHSGIIQRVASGGQQCPGSRAPEFGLGTPLAQQSSLPGVGLLLRRALALLGRLVAALAAGGPRQPAGR